MSMNIELEDLLINEAKLYDYSKPKVAERVAKGLGDEITNFCKKLVEKKRIKPKTLNSDNNPNASGKLYTRKWILQSEYTKFIAFQCY